MQIQQGVRAKEVYLVNDVNCSTNFILIVSLGFQQYRYTVVNHGFSFFAAAAIVLETTNRKEKAKERIQLNKKRE